MYTPIVVYSISLASLALLADAGVLPGVAHLHSFALGDKCAHFLIAGSLALVANLTLSRRSEESSSTSIDGITSRSIFRITIAILALVTCEELTNMLSAYRNFDLTDLAANYLGVLTIGVAPILIWRVLRKPVGESGIAIPQA